MERLVAGRERIYLDRFWNDFAGDPAKVDEGTRRHYAELYARPGAMHSAFAQFRSIRQDAEDNKAGLGAKLAKPVAVTPGSRPPATTSRLARASASRPWASLRSGLEATPRPGLPIQIANGRGLLPRLEAIDALLDQPPRTISLS